MGSTSSGGGELNDEEFEGEHFVGAGAADHEVGFGAEGEGPLHFLEAELAREGHDFLAHKVAGEFGLGFRQGAVGAVEQPVDEAEDFIRLFA